MRSFNYSGYVEIDVGVCYDKADRRRGYDGGGINIPKDKFKEFVEFQKKWVWES